MKLGRAERSLSGFPVPLRLSISSPRFSFFVLARFPSGECAPKFSMLRGVADLRHEPGLWSDAYCHLLLDGLANWRRAKGDRMTSLGDSDVVLSSVLAEEQSLFTVEQACQVEPAYRYVYF